MQAHTYQMFVPRGLWRPKDGEPSKPRVETHHRPAMAF